MSESEVLQVDKSASIDVESEVLVPAMAAIPVTTRAKRKKGGSKGGNKKHKSQVELPNVEDTAEVAIFKKLGMNQQLAQTVVAFIESEDNAFSGNYQVVVHWKAFICYERQRRQVTCGDCDKKGVAGKFCILCLVRGGLGKNIKGICIHCEESHLEKHKQCRHVMDKI